MVQMITVQNQSETFDEESLDLEGKLFTRFDVFSSKLLGSTRGVDRENFFPD